MSRVTTPLAALGKWFFSQFNAQDGSTLFRWNDSAAKRSRPDRVKVLRKYRPSRDICRSAPWSAVSKQNKVRALMKHVEHNAFRPVKIIKIFGESTHRKKSIPSPELHVGRPENDRPRNFVRTYTVALLAAFIEESSPMHHSLLQIKRIPE